VQVQAQQISNENDRSRNLATPAEVLAFYDGFYDDATTTLISAWPALLFT
jgi:hypothetical protein